MAGLGFKDFAVGEVLTSADVDGYLMQQTVMRFADSAARGSALGTATGTAVALAEGMVSYLDDKNAIDIYDGTSWVALSKLVTVKHAIRTTTQTFSGVAAGSLNAVGDLSITHAMTDASNKLIISAYLGAAANTNGRGAVSIAITQGTALIGVGDAAGNRTQVGAGGWTSPDTSADDILVVVNPSMTFVFEPGDTSSHTYTVNAVNNDDGAETLYINRTEQDTNTAGVRVRASSALVIQEVAP